MTDNKFLPQKIMTLLALVAVLIGYFWVHKPTNINIFLSVGGALLDFASAAGIVLVSGAVGRAGLRRMNLDVLTMPERTALEAMIGMGVLSLLLLIAGLLGGFQQVLLLAIFIIIGLLLRKALAAWLADLVSMRRFLLPKTQWTQLLMLFTGLLLFTALLHSFAPPGAWDGMTYHLVGPKRYLAAGTITAYSDNHFMGFPQSAEMLYTAAIAFFGRDSAAAPLHFCVGIFGLMATAGVVRRYTNSTAAWTSVFLLISSYSMWTLFGYPYIDLGVMAFGALAITAATAWRETHTTQWLLLMGVLAGLALGMKYTAVGLLIMLGLFVILQDVRRAPRHLLLIGAAAAVVFLPWAVKGLFLYQNPLYPYFLNGLNWDNTRSALFNLSGFGFLNSPEVWQLPLLPISATIFGVDKAGRFAFTAGPWLLTFPFLALPGWLWLDERARALLRDCVRLALPALLFWGFLGATNYIGAQTRLMLFALPLAAVLGGVGFYSLSLWPKQPLDIYFVARAMLLFTSILTLMDVLADTAKSKVVDYLSGTLSREAYLHVNLGVYYGAMRQLETLPNGAQVLFMWEPKSYYCPETLRCTPDVIFDHWSRPLLHNSAPDDIFAVWQARGEDYLLLYDYGYEFWFNEHTHLQPQNSLFPQTLTRWMTPIWTDNTAYTLYTWKDR